MIFYLNNIKYIGGYKSLSDIDDSYISSMGTLYELNYNPPPIIIPNQQIHNFLIKYMENKEHYNYNYKYIKIYNDPGSNNDNIKLSWINTKILFDKLKSILNPNINTLYI